jgi:uncharacterized protein YegJ (DUF2314 family)
MDTDREQLVPVFVPALGPLLIHAEDQKGEPLSETEVLRIRDNAACIMMPIVAARKLEESRGYRDLDPENCWHDWQLLRAELGRTPALPPGPRFAQIPQDDPAYRQTIQDAQESLDGFLGLISTVPQSGAMPMVKAEIIDGQARAFLWLCNARPHEGGFIAQFFEVPTQFTSRKVGDEIPIAREAVLDWMVNRNGVLHGGYSLRYQRSRLPEAERPSFDEYIGVTEYV